MTDSLLLVGVNAGAELGFFILLVLVLGRSIAYYVVLMRCAQALHIVDN